MPNDISLWLTSHGRVKTCVAHGCVLLTLFALSGCDKDSNRHKVAEPHADKPVVINQQSVWTDGAIFDVCHQPEENGRLAGCMIDALYRAKASADVVKAMELFSADGDIGYVSAFRQVGPAGIVTVTHPFRANTNDETWLIGQKSNVNVDNPSLSEEDTANDEYADLVKQHPDATPFPPAHLTRIDHNVDGSISMRFDTPMRTCHACESLGWLSIAYDFNSQGNFLGHHLVSIESTEAGF